MSAIDNVIRKGGYEGLANAIIVQATEDWRDAKRLQKELPAAIKRQEKAVADAMEQFRELVFYDCDEMLDYETFEYLNGKCPHEKQKEGLQNLTLKLSKARSLERDCEQFFHSEWFKKLTPLDGDSLLRALKAGFEMEQKARSKKVVERIRERVSRGVIIREY